MSRLFDTECKQSIKPFSKSDINQKMNTKTDPKIGTKSNNQLIPLFCNTYPRIDCLKLIYKQINVFKTNINRVNPKQVLNPKMQSFSPTNSLNHQKNGFKTGVTPLFERHKNL